MLFSRCSFLHRSQCTMAAGANGATAIALVVACVVFSSLLLSLYIATLNNIILISSIFALPINEPTFEPCFLRFTNHSSINYFGRHIALVIKNHI